EAAGSDDLIVRVAGPLQEGRIDVDDRPVGRRREKPARRLVVERLGAFRPHRRRRRRPTSTDASGVAHLRPTNSSIAAIVSSGELKLGQWPVVFKTTNSLPSMCS